MCDDCEKDATKTVDFTVVGVDKIVVAGSRFTGPAYVCVGESITLTAVPKPDGASFPSGHPDWSLESKPNGSSAALTANGASADLAIDKPGEYVVKVECGNSNDTITIKSTGFDKIIVTGSTPPDDGPAEICLGDSIALEALPAPAGASFEQGDPQWSITQQPNGSTLSDLPDGSDDVTITPDVAGEYIIKAEVCGASSDTFTVTAIGIDKIVVKNSNPPEEGPINLPMGESIILKALPDPDGASFPDGHPHWSVENKPNGSTATLNTNGATAELTPDKPGIYEIKAACGGSSDTFTVRFIAMDLDRIVTLWPPQVEGPISLCVGNRIDLEALPSDPNKLPYPPGYPHWFLQKPDGSDATLDARGNTANLTPNVPGEYIVKAAFGDSNDEFTIYAVSAELASLEFTSDPNVLCQGTDGPTWAVNGRCPKVEWTSAGTNAPITHKTKETVSIDLKLEGYFPPGASYSITGESAENALDFQGSGTTPGAGGNTLTSSLIAMNGLGCEIRKINEAINWSISFQNPNGFPNADCDLGSTGAHIIYTTFDTPAAGKATPPRMELGNSVVNDALTSGGIDACDPCWPKLVWEINKKQGIYFLGRNLIGNTGGAWRLPEVSSSGAAAYAYDTDTGDINPSMTIGADCISIATFVADIGEVMGIPGSFNTETYMAYYRTPGDLDRPKTAVSGSLNVPPINPGDKGPPSILVAAFWSLALADSHCIPPGGGTPGSVGSRGGLNAFEAAVLYTYNGTTYYIPGGTHRFYDNKDHVVWIFQSLVWVDSVDKDGDPMTMGTVLEVMAVDWWYNPAPNATPCP